MIIIIIVIASFIYLCDGLSNNTLIEVISALISLRLIRIMLPFKSEHMPLRKPCTLINYCSC